MGQYIAALTGAKLVRLNPYVSQSLALLVPALIIRYMKAHVYVTLKTSVLDPQGQTIQNALRKLGYGEVASVRQGKYFAIELAAGLTPDAAREQVERVSREVLTNPVIEEYTYRIEE